MQDFCRSKSLDINFVKAAAPTGTAAWNIRFNATTIHRLINWFNVDRFNEIQDDTHLAKFQAMLNPTGLIILDEVSMIGRKMMSRIDRRFRQAKAGKILGITALEVCL